MQNVLAEVETEGGKELAIEVCCTVAAFETITRVADATIRKQPTAAMMNVIKGINKIALHSRELMLVGSTIAVVSVAVLIATRRS